MIPNFQHPRLMESRIGVIVELPHAADLRPQPHIDRATVGWNSKNRLAERRTNIVTEDIPLSLYRPHIQPVRRGGRSGEPRERYSAAVQRRTRTRTRDERLTSQSRGRICVVVKLPH